jgi:hypothetical protein
MASFDGCGWGLEAFASSAGSAETEGALEMGTGLSPRGGGGGEDGREWRLRAFASSVGSAETEGTLEMGTGLTSRGGGGGEDGREWRLKAFTSSAGSAETEGSAAAGVAVMGTGLTSSGGGGREGSGLGKNVFIRRGDGLEMLIGLASCETWSEGGGRAAREWGC